MKKKLLLISAAVLTISVLLTVPSHSVQIYSSGPPDENSGDSMPQWIILANDFTLACTAEIDEIRFYAVDNGFGGFSRDVGWRIYEDNAGMPGAIIDEGVATAGAAVDHGWGGIYTSYLMTLSIDTVTLDPGTYWLGLHDGSFQSTQGYSLMLWEASAGGSSNYVPYHQEYLGGAGWGSWAAGSGEYNYAFKLFGLPILQGDFDDDIDVDGLDLSKIITGSETLDPSIFAQEFGQSY
jgi:hypothetical protein